jgi:uncharacterized protein (DUF58 family)
MATPEVAVHERLLPAHRAAQLERLSLQSRRPLVGALTGQHGSPRRGSSLDFSDYRQYVAGDDFRRIDFNLLARLDQFVVKLYDAEDDLTVHLLVDDSASMSFGGKFEQAQQLAAALAFVTLRHRDTVVLHSLHNSPLRCSGRIGLHAALNYIEAQRTHGVTPLPGAIHAVLGQRGPRGLLVVISDFLTPQWDAAIRSLPQRTSSRAIAIQVLHPDEIDPTLAGDLDLIDVETKERLSVSLDDKALKEVRTHIATWMQELADQCRRIGFDYSLLLATEDLDEHLSRSWRRMELLQ